jgi:tripartite-type tricarboxylate transporter receptor subunit TctC
VYVQQQQSEEKDMKSATACAALLAAASLVPAQAAPVHAGYPERPVRWIVPVAPGGGNDIVARMLAQKLTEKWGQPFVVDNRPGAATAIGSDILAKATPNGYTIMLCSASFAINAAVHSHLPFDPIKDFAPITLAARVPQILVVNPKLSAKTLQGFIALAKREPGKIDYASAGTGSSTHLAMELFEKQAGIVLNHVPYKGTAPGLTDVIAGRVKLTFDAVPPVLAHLKAGAIRALAVTGTHRVQSVPDVPTFAESGLPHYDFSSWFAIMAPAGTPPAIIEQLNRALVEVIRHSDVHDRLLKMGIEPVGSTPAELGAHLRKEIAQWTRVAEERHIRE